ncbi:cob(I)yrinic acid a,c-diamide adenosyltransferase [Candidatus Daviesbacteria bacterium]|nr:cob(I)yrinic acid a,c-diamide adenosyltransferase [Candidatus Daviesbacteria bacterium]
MKSKGKIKDEKNQHKKIQYKEATRGLVIVYTGEGKGKTTASLGLVLRAAGYKRKVLIVQFGKIWFTGELEGVKMLAPYVKIVQGGLGFVKIFDDQSKFSEHVKVANKTFEYLYKEVTSNKWDVVVADEIVGAVAGKLLKHSHLAKLIKDKPVNLDLVLTGHHGKKSLFKLADLVTEMTPIKHPFEKGILAKPGVDY